jgi:acetyltransferase-like isoleucine patch superfamily enzyme
MRGYLEEKLFLRPSCHECSFKGTPRFGDFTLADFWGIENVDPAMDDNQGTSLVLVNSEKAQAIFENVKSSFTVKNFPLSDAIKSNPAFHSCARINKEKNNLFWKRIDSMKFDEAIKPCLEHKPSHYRKKIRSLYYTAKTIGFSPKRLISTLYWSYCTKKVKHSVALPLVFVGKHCWELRRGATLEVNARTRVGVFQVAKSSLEARLLLEENSKLIINGNFSFYTGSFVRIIKGGCLVLGSGFINEGVEITCASKIIIGHGCAIARGVSIRDFDAHTINIPDYQIAQPIHIGNHVWIGERAMIRKGVTVGDGAVVASGAIVTKNVPPRCIVAGVPAKIVRENVDWY